MLTGHADLKGILDAVNQGEIYCFLLKPWDDEELRMNIRQALDYYYLRQEASLIARTVKKQSQILQELEKEHPGIGKIEKSEDGSIVLSEEDLRKTVDELIEKNQGK